MLQRINQLHHIGRTKPNYLYLRFDLTFPEADIGIMQRTIRGAKELTVKVWTPMYEGDSIVHYRANVALPESSFPPRPRRSLWAAIRKAMASLFGWLEASADRARYRELERYLADSGDVFELERRIRSVERGYGANFDPYL